MEETLFSMLMHNMGLDADYLRRINEPTHDTLKDIDVLCEQLHELRSQGKKLGIYPDIDTDGLTSGTLGLAGFAELGFDVELYIPNASKGHGVFPEDITSFVNKHQDLAAIITCDTGITAFDGVNKAHELGVKIFVTDHHKEFLDADGNRLPADVVVNPARIDETYAHPDICGAYVLYQVLEEYARRYAPHKIDAIMLLKLYAGMGTIADVMPVLYENRELIRTSIGLMRLFYQEPVETYDVTTNSMKLVIEDINASLMMRIVTSENHHPTFIRAFRGVAAIVAAYTMNGKIRSRESIDESFTGFYIAPMINAIRRLNEDITIGFSAFVGSQPLEHAQYLLDVNDRRKEKQKEYVEYLKNTPQPLAPYIYTIDHAPSGMLGLLANAMMNESHVPTLVVSQRGDGTHGGSGRSPEWYPFNSKLNEFGFWAQGHEHAFGARLGNWDDMCQAYEIISADSENIAAALRAEGQVIDVPEADLVLGEHPEADAPLDELEELLDLVEQLHMLKPFGHGFRSPTIDIVSDARRVSTRTMGSEQQHISVSTPAGMKMVSWNNDRSLPKMREIILDSDSETKILLHCLGDLERNEWMNNVSANLICNSMYLEIKKSDGSIEKITL